MKKVPNLLKEALKTEQLSLGQIGSSWCSSAYLCSPREYLSSNRQKRIRPDHKDEGLAARRGQLPDPNPGALAERELLKTFVFNQI